MRHSKMRKPALKSTSLSRLQDLVGSLQISEGEEESSASYGSPPAVSEEEIMAVMVQKAPITARDLVSNFVGRLRSREEKDNFARMLRKMARLRKSNGINYLVMREGFSTPSVKTESTESNSRPGAVSCEEIRAVLIEKSPITLVDLVRNFFGRLRSKEEKEAFAVILNKMGRVMKIGGISYIEPREWSCDGKQARLQSRDSRLKKIQAVPNNIHKSLQ